MSASPAVSQLSSPGNNNNNNTNHMNNNSATVGGVSVTVGNNAPTTTSNNTNNSQNTNIVVNVNERNVGVNGNTNGGSNGSIAVICSVINGQDQDAVNRNAFLSLNNQQQQQQQQDLDNRNGLAANTNASGTGDRTTNGISISGINLMQERNRQLQERVLGDRERILQGTDRMDRIMEEIISQERIEQVRNTMHPPPLVISNHIQLNNAHDRGAEKNLNSGGGGSAGVMPAMTSPRPV